MDWANLYHIVFETYAGIGILVGGGILLSLLVCVFFEFRTRKLYFDHKPTEDDWSFFDDDEDEESNEAPAKSQKASGK